MKNILHTNLPAVRHEWGAPGETPAPSFQIGLPLMARPLQLLHPTKKTTTTPSTIWATPAYDQESMPFLRGMSKPKYFERLSDPHSKYGLKVKRSGRCFEGFYHYFFFSPPVSNYKHLAAEQINHSVSWVIAQNSCKIIHSEMIKWQASNTPLVTRG